MSTESFSSKLRKENDIYAATLSHVYRRRNPEATCSVIHWYSTTNQVRNNLFNVWVASRDVYPWLRFTQSLTPPQCAMFYFWMWSVWLYCVLRGSKCVSRRNLYWETVCYDGPKAFYSLLGSFGETRTGPLTEPVSQRFLFFVWVSPFGLL